MLKCDNVTCGAYNTAQPSGCNEYIDISGCKLRSRGGIADTLLARGERYGDYAEQCRISQNIKRAMIDSLNWMALSDDKKEALEIIAVKMGRILNGDPEYADSWHDISGYAKLVEDTLK